MNESTKVGEFRIYKITSSFNIKNYSQQKIRLATGNMIAQVAFAKRYDHFEDPEFSIIMQAWVDFFHTGALAFNV